MGAAEVERFLSDLAVRGQVAASTQNQALSALLFLYREVLSIDLPWLDNVVRAKRPQRLPTVLSQDEARRLLAAMDGRPWLIASLLYGTGMRLMECLRLRVKDIDFARHEITVREGKGGKDRRTMLPRALAESLQREIERARVIHAEDLAAGFGATRLPHVLARKYPRTAHEFGWQFVFPSVQRMAGSNMHERPVCGVFVLGVCSRQQQASCLTPKRRWQLLNPFSPGVYFLLTS